MVDNGEDEFTTKNVRWNEQLKYKKYNFVHVFHNVGTSQLYLNPEALN